MWKFQEIFPRILGMLKVITILGKAKGHIRIDIIVIETPPK